MTAPLLSRLALAVLVGLAAVRPAAAQATDPFSDEPEARGTAYFVFAEPGAPTFEVVMLGPGLRSGIYRIQEGTTLVRLLALAGGTARSDSSRVRITTTTVRVVREVDGAAQTIYEVQPERLLAERARHPDLQDGDLIESTVRTEEIPPPRKRFTFQEGLNVASGLASLVTIVLVLARTF